MNTFPFGRPVLPVSREPGGVRPLFILGAYPSALHVAWKPPGNFKPIKAMAVDNEPEPFWNGRDEAERIAAWMKAAQFVEAKHGSVGPAGKLNGSSGRWVDEHILAPLRFERGQAWITDCLDTYRCSEKLAKRIEDTYAPFAREARLKAAQLEPHPSENEIVAEADRKRLKRELDKARPDVVVTLGNAALRVFRELVTDSARDQLPSKLSASRETYGVVLSVRVAGRVCKWLPLAHPAAPPPYKKVHGMWKRAC